MVSPRGLGARVLSGHPHGAGGLSWCPHTGKLGLGSCRDVRMWAGWGLGSCRDVPKCARRLLQAPHPFLQFTNRCLLKWLRRWDQVVFGHERPARKPRAGVEPGRGGKDAAAPGKWKSHEQVLEELLEAELDASRRPRHKVSWGTAQGWGAQGRGGGQPCPSRSPLSVL